MGGFPNDHDAKNVIKKLQKSGHWEYNDDVGGSAHICGWLLCGDGCEISVMRTASNTAMTLWRRARKCPHGSAPRELKP